MLTSIRGLVAATFFVGAAFAATPAFADEAEAEAPADITVSGYVTGVTDYRFRGLSLSGGDYAIQGSINVNHSSGFYVGTWGSSLEESLVTDPISGESVYGNAELDLYGGWTGEVTSGVTADVGLLYYVYPNGKIGKANYFEPYVSLSTTMGPVSAKVGVNYAWEQDSLGGDDNVYVYTDLGFTIPETPVGLSAHLGYADGAQSPKLLTGTGTGGGFDYSVGATYNVTDKLSVGVSYIGVEGASIDDFSDDAVVGTVKLAF
jgi:uncharacterized protein (TIGR02001 family)